MDTLADRLPFRTSMSLEKVIDFWISERDRRGSIWASQAREVLARLEHVPELRGPRIDPAVARRHPELIRMLLSAHFAEASVGSFGSASVPFSYDTIYETPGSDALGVLGQAALFTGTRFEPEMMVRGMIMAGYEHVLRFVYGIDVDFDPPLVITVHDPDSGLQRHFQIVWDSRFMTVTADEGTRRATPDELEELLAEPMDFERWAEVLPPDRFELGGLGITWAVEVTGPEASSLLKEALLRKDALSSRERIEELEAHIRTLLGQADIEMGLIAFDGDASIEGIDRAFPLGKSLLMSGGSAPKCPSRENSSYAEVFRTPAPHVVRDLETCGCNTGFEHRLLQDGIRSLALLPLFVDARLVGLLEVGSRSPGAVTMYQALKLKAVTSAFATALQRSLAEREDQIQSVIKQKYTAIHPSVEWRFRDAASHVLGIADHDDHPDQEEIVFHGVYPLYGLTDIRGSSDTRARAIQADLSAQIELARAVITEASRHRPLPALDELGYRLVQLGARVAEGLVSEDESQVLAFLGGEVEPLMDQLAGFGDTVAPHVEAYRTALDPELGVVYRERRDFESSVARFNEAVCAVIDREQVIAQDVLPHFFERFKTDGVDYNLYVGESIAERGGFSKLYLHNLRLWQLQLVSRVQWELDRVRPEMATDLLPTHLILVQDQPLAIRFRVDEKRFDVDGAYNMRYELVKKRIDKARIRGTSERLTQPGMLAVVYSHNDEGHEYRRYLEYLIADGFFEGEIEQHDLEDMQGVLGLKAFRVAVRREVPFSAPIEGRRPSLRRVEEIVVGGG
ncbi:MAG: GAF domain-containing protein [Gemmatimonadetes bacterium]|nr:GAF domain-containing protein [Gemmatimonadota bacterium]NNF38938.1 GAF domain-containing protein [Gemmatimonadota bacterium]